MAVVYHVPKIPISAFEKFRTWRTCSKRLAPGRDHENRRLPGTGVKSEERVNGTRRSIRNIPTGRTGQPFH